MKTNVSKIVLSILAVLAPLPFAAAQSSLRLDWFAISGGTGSSTSGPYTLSAVIGLPESGSGSAGGITLQGGFWNSSPVIGEPPTLLCPSNQLVWTCGAGAVVTYGISATAHCGSKATLKCDPPDGSFLSVGTQPVKCAVFDECGGGASCQFSVTVVSDTHPPLLTCPENFSVDCEALWNFGAPRTVDDCSGTNVALKIIGTTTNTQCGHTYFAQRVWRATDLCGNSTTCTQTVNVVDTTPPLLLCKADRILECGVIWEFGVPAAFESCDETGVALSILSTVTNALCGGTFNAARVWQAMDACGNTGTCTQSVTVVDTMPPAITCPQSLTLFSCNAKENVSYTVDATDQCDPAPAVACVPPSGSSFEPGTHEVKCTATDACGNTAGCKFTVTIVPDSTPPKIHCPADIVGSTESGQCTKSNVTYTATAIDNCPGVTVTCNPASGSAFAKGVTTVTCKASDMAGNNSTCSFTVTIDDKEKPVVLCPANIVASTDSGQCTKSNVTYTATATDNCPGVTVTCNPASGATFAKGVTTVTCTASDTAGNNTTCSFTVTINDAEKPVILCPANIVASTDSGQCTKSNVTYTATATDNCPGVTVTCNPASGSNFAKDVASVTCTASDTAGNQSTCSFTVTINDTEKPVITCPADMTVTATSKDGASAHFAASATDACDLAPTLACTPAAGSLFPVGTNKVTCIARDTSGNSNSCAFTVTVLPRIPQPTLKIRMETEKIVVSWPVWAVGFKLQTTMHPEDPKSWTDWKDPVVVVGEEFTATSFPPWRPENFFRLAHP